MDFVKEISTPILDIGNKLGDFLIPSLVLVTIALLAFAFFSFRLFKVVLPLVGMLFGYVIGYEFLTPVLKGVFKGAGVLTTDILAGIICAVLIGFICLKSYNFTILAAGAGIGYVFLAELSIVGLRQIKFVQDVLVNTDMETAAILGIILSITCGLFTMLLLNKFFNFTYIFSTSIIAVTAAFVIPAIFIFNGDANFESTVLLASDIGAVVGAVIGGIQFAYHRYD